MRNTVLAFFVLALPDCVSLPADDSALWADNERISAPVVYENLMLIISTKDGVAAIAFDKEIKEGKRDFKEGGRFKQGIAYHYRFLPAGKGKVVSGNGEVFEKANSVPGKKPGVFKVIDEGSQLFIKAGPMKLEWSYSNEARGWIYYRPEDVRVQIADTKEFEKIRLSRFIK